MRHGGAIEALVNQRLELRRYRFIAVHAAGGEERTACASNGIGGHAGPSLFRFVRLRDMPVRQAEFFGLAILAEVVLAGFSDRVLMLL